MTTETRRKELLAELEALAAAESTDIIKAPDHIYNLLKSYGTKKQEHFLVLTLDGKNSIIKRHVISKGTANRTMVHPRDVFRAAIKDNAVSIIIAHNHPSGAVTPSSEDDIITKRLKDAGEIVGISVLDHIVIGKYKDYSYSEMRKI